MNSATPLSAHNNGLRATGENTVPTTTTTIEIDDSSSDSESDDEEDPESEEEKASTTTGRKRKSLEDRKDSGSGTVVRKRQRPETTGRKIASALHGLVRAAMLPIRQAVELYMCEYPHWPESLVDQLKVMMIMESRGMCLIFLAIGDCDLRTAWLKEQMKNLN